MAPDKTIDLAVAKSTKEPRPIKPNNLLKHGVILAQSGSGKSFMLGRLLEELMLKTQGRVIVLDPNSDFIRLAVPDPNVWNDAKLLPWFYPGESQPNFASSWKDAGRLVVASNHNLESAKRIVMDWGNLSLEDMSAILDIDIHHDSDLYWYLFLTRQVAHETWDQDVEAFYDFEHFLEKCDQVIEYVTSGQGPVVIKDNPLAQTLRSSTSGQVALAFRALVDAAANYEIWRSRGDGEVDVCDFVDSEAEPQTLIVDLQSLVREEERISVATGILRTLWLRRRQSHWEAIRDFEKSDTRNPLFLFIDEAHNIVPQHKENPAIRELSGEIVRIAAEGRKYGIHLIVATQRPRKVDASVLSECDNLYLMKTTNVTDLDFIVDSLGYVAKDIAYKAREFSVGDMILAGGLGGGETVLHVSPRRTYQGGKGLSETHWLQ